MSKQTAITWLIEQMEIKPMSIFEILGIVDQAKNIEREQHSQTWDNAIEQLSKRGGVKERALVDFDEYFNEKYNGK